MRDKPRLLLTQRPQSRSILYSTSRKVVECHIPYAMANSKTGIYQMARFSWAGAEKDFEIVLSKHSSNVIALMGKVSFCLVI